MAYVIQSKRSPPELFSKLLPLSFDTKNGTSVVLDVVNASSAEELEQCRTLLNVEIERGQSYPYEEPLSEEGFRAYFLSHDAFTVKPRQSNEVLGIFYIKPNFPGRCSHICNGGFVVKDSARGQGIGKFMAVAFLHLARAIGYRAVMYNLVFVTNKVSVLLWSQLGFRQLAVIPKAGNLKEHGYTDAIQFHMDLTTELPSIPTKATPQQQ